MDEFTPSSNEKVAVIMNGWYMHNGFAFPPSPYIIPLFIGTHFARDTKYGEYVCLDAYGTEYLKKYEPIGCRDISTVKALGQRGVEGYFSGCLTMTLKPFEDVKPSRRIILTDVEEPTAEYVRRLLPDREIVTRTHALKEEEMCWDDWSLREERVVSMLKEYQAADLIITTRLHCTLPATALGTPVILLKKDNLDYQDRVSDYYQFVKSYTNEEVLMGFADEAVLHPEALGFSERITAKMRETCESFIERTSMQSYDMSDLPDVELYERIYSKRASRMKSAIEELSGYREAMSVLETAINNGLVEIVKKN